jgi:hypothetical protein
MVYLPTSYSVAYIYSIYKRVSLPTTSILALVLALALVVAVLYYIVNDSR